MDYNTRCGHYSIFPCECNPPCLVPSEEQLGLLSKTVKSGVDKLKTECTAKAPIAASFDKIAFPVIKNMSLDSAAAKDFIAGQDIARKNK